MAQVLSGMEPIAYAPGKQAAEKQVDIDCSAIDSCCLLLLNLSVLIKPVCCVVLIQLLCICAIQGFQTHGKFARACSACRWAKRRL